VPARYVFLLLWLALWLTGCNAPLAQPGLTLAYPARLRAGEVGNLSLTLEVPAGVLEQIFETHNVLAEARLELPGVQVKPNETVSETLRPGQQAVFFWNILSEEAGSFEGQVWFYLRFVPKAGGPETRQALSVQRISLEVETLFGLKAATAGWLGALGLVLSAGLGAPLWQPGLKRMLLRLGQRS